MAAVHHSWWMEGVSVDTPEMVAATSKAMLEQYVAYLQVTRAPVFRADPLEPAYLVAMIGHAARASRSPSTLQEFASIKNIEQADIGAHMRNMIDQGSDRAFSNSRDAFSACIAACRGYLAGRMTQLADFVSKNPTDETVWRVQPDTKFCSPSTETIRQKLVQWDNAE